MHPRIQTFLILLSLTVFSLFVTPGYAVFAGDHAVSLPNLYHALTPTLYKNDFSLQFQQDAFVYFDELLLFFLRNLPLDIYALFFLLSFLFRFLAISAISALVRYFTGDALYSFLAPLLFFFSQPVFGAAIGMFEPALYPRFASLTLSLLFLVLFFRGRTLFSALLLSFAIFLHPLSALPFFLFFVISCLVSFYRHDTRFSSFFLSLAIPTFAGFFSFFSGPASTLSLFTQIDPLWKSILLSRVSYLYITEWHYSLFFVLLSYLLLSLTLFSSLHQLLKTNTRRFPVYLFFLLPLFLTLLSFFTVDIFNFHFFAQLQLTRSLLLFRFFVLLFFGYFTYRNITSGHSHPLHLFSSLGILFALMIEEFFLLLYLPLYLALWIQHERKYHLPLTSFSLSVLFAILLMFFAALLYVTQGFTLLTYLFLIFFLSLFFTWLLPFLSSRSPSFLPRILLLLLPLLSLLFIPFFSLYPPYFANEPFMDMCSWIREHTPEDALFLTEPFSSTSGPVRMTCLRSVFVSHKEGAQSAFQRAYALEWDKRMQLLDSLASHTTSFSALAQEYSVDYVLSEEPLSLPLAYSNSRYYLYQLHQTPQPLTLARKPLYRSASLV